MSDEKVLPTLYVLWRQSEDGNMQLTFAVGKSEAKRRMESEGFRVFEMRHERFAEDLCD